MRGMRLSQVLPAKEWMEHLPSRAHQLSGRNPRAPKPLAEPSQVEASVEGPLVAGRAYSRAVVITSTTGASRRLELLLQVRAGVSKAAGPRARPVPRIRLGSPNPVPGACWERRQHGTAANACSALPPTTACTVCPRDPGPSPRSQPHSRARDAPKCPPPPPPFPHPPSSLLPQIPEGALPLAGHPVTHASQITLAPYSCDVATLQFYFPRPGTFKQPTPSVTRGGRPAWLPAAPPPPRR